MGTAFQSFRRVCEHKNPPLIFVHLVYILSRYSNMYLIIVALLLIFLTMFYSMREGVENILDKSTILATETEVQLPNRVSGSRGEDITFAGDINLEHKNSIELGKGTEKGPNAGKIRYNHDKLDIFGAGQTDESYKIKLWDNVEVGGLLQSDMIQLGNDNNKGGIEYDKTNQKVNVKGYGTDGTRKVKIWDEVEVGQLLAKKGIEVYGPLTAQNDVNVKGKLFANNGMSVVGDVEIVGNINNIPINNRFTQLEKRVTENHKSTLDAGVVPSIQKQVDTLKDTINQNVTTVGNVQNQLKDIANQLKQAQSKGPVSANSGSNSGAEPTNSGSNSGAAPTNSGSNSGDAPTNSGTNSGPNLGQFNASFEQLKMMMDQKIAVANGVLLGSLQNLESSTSNSTNMTELYLNSRLAKFEQAIQNLSVQSNNAYENANDWMNTKSTLFENDDKIMAWSSIDPTHLMTLSGLTERQIANLAPLDHENFSQDFLALANNASHNYGMLSDMINEESTDYYGYVNQTFEEYVLPNMSMYNASISDLYPFYTEWYDENGGFDNASNEKISKIEYTYRELDKLMDASRYFNVNTINASLRNVSETANTKMVNMLSNINTSFKNMSENISTQFDEVNSRHYGLDRVAVKQNLSTGNVIIPGNLTIQGQQLTLGNAADRIWEFLAQAANVTITKKN